MPINYIVLIRNADIYFEHIIGEKDVQRFRVKCVLLGSKAGKGRPLSLGRMSANDGKTVYS